MNPFWRNLAIMIVLAAAAAYVGARFGAQPAPPPQKAMLRDSVYQLVHHDLKLTSVQADAIRTLDARYDKRRNTLRADIISADAELAQALAAEMSIGTEAQHSLDHLQTSVGNLQRETVLYVLDVRAVLTPEQQMLLDRKIFDSLALGQL